MPRALAVLLLCGTLGCGAYGSRPAAEPPSEREQALERLRQDCPDYVREASPEQLTHLLGRVILPGYPECVLVHVLGEPRARRPVPRLPGVEWWFYDRDPGYLQLTVEDGRLASWSRCDGCPRFYER